METFTIVSRAVQVRGVSYKPEDLHSSLNDSSVILLRANNIDDGKINFDDVVFVDKKRVSNEQFLRKGDILVCASSGSKNLVGKAASVDFDKEVTFGAFCKAVRPRNIEDAEYLAMFFQSPIYRHQIAATAIGANINNIRNEHIDTLSVKWPATVKRKEIVDILSKAEAIIRIRKKQLSTLDDLIKARFVEMFGDPVANTLEWKTALLREVTSKIGSGATPRGGKESYQAEGITLIRSMNVHDGRFEYKDLAHITDEQAAQLNNVSVEEGDVFINITGASVARSCIVPKDTLPARVNQHVAIIRCVRNLLNPTFANNMFLNDRFKEQLLDIGESGGATRQAITKQQLEGLTVILPPMNQQEEFAAFVAQVDKSKSVIQKSLNETQLLFDSLMQQYFG